MSLLSEARHNVEVADLVILCMVEHLRQSEGTFGWANHVTISQQIGGSSRNDIHERLEKMRRIGLLDRDPDPKQRTYRVTPMGLQMLVEDVDNFEPSPREQERRFGEMATALQARVGR